MNQIPSTLTPGHGEPRTAGAERNATRSAPSMESTVRRTPAPGVARGGAVPNPRTALRVLGLEQLALLGICALRITLDWLGWKTVSIFRAAAGPEEPEACRKAFRDRAIGRLVATLGILKGVYVKAGQFAAVRHDLLPASATQHFARLRDRVPPLRFSEVRTAVERELRAPLTTLFAEFDREPLGAASIAQVHRARLHSGEEVAVKVQYPWLQASLTTDLRIVRALILLGLRMAESGRRGPRSNRRRFLDEFESGLAEELDFEHEALSRMIKLKRAIDAR